MLKKVKYIMLMVFVLISIMQPIAYANTVEYRGEPEGLIATPDDFFLNFGELLPGDDVQDVAYIRNTTNDEIEVFFKTEPLSRQEYYDDVDYSLLEEIKLTITLKRANEDEKLIYEGNLGAELMKEYISLGTYEKGFDGEFRFKLDVPETLRNKFTLSSTKVKWVFYVEKHEIKEDKPKTGDNIWVSILALVLVIILITIIVVKRRKNYEE